MPNKAGARPSSSTAAPMWSVRRNSFSSLALGLPLCPEGHGYCTAPGGPSEQRDGGDQGPPQLQREAYALLTQAGQAGILHFVGNTEAREVPLGQVDVIVCDGYAGNVLLKSIEGTAMFMGSMMKRMFQKEPAYKAGGPVL